MPGAIFYDDAQDASLAETLALHFSLVLSDKIFPRLQIKNQRVHLLDAEQQPIALDWNDDKWLKRSKGMTGRDPMVRATMASKGVKIVDMTAGWGKDGLLMAHAGANVTMLEQHPYMAALLIDAWQHLASAAIQSRIKIAWTSAHDYLSALNKESFPDVIYCDPMHPIRQKSALVKKHLQVLQQLTQPNDDVVDLICLAQKKCTQRVVLKWPQKQKPPIIPMGSIPGKTIRFDLFSPSIEK
jgi:16S rRNA (guanine1516-N2)-methyltransferase